MKGLNVSAAQLVKELYHEVQEDQVLMGAAALAYYLLLSLFPALIFLLTLLPYLPIPDLAQQIMTLLEQVLPGEAAGLLTRTIHELVAQPRGGLLSLGLLLSLWSSSTGLYAIMQQLNVTYDVTEQRPFWKVRGVALLLTLVFFVLILGALLLIVLGGLLEDRLVAFLGGAGILQIVFTVLRWLIVAVFLNLALALTYYWGPNVEQSFRFISPGSILGVLVLAAASLGFRFYVSSFGNFNATYGSLGAAIVLLLWLYITGVVLLLGSEVNSLLEHHAGEGKQKGDKKEPPPGQGAPGAPLH